HNTGTSHWLDPRLSKFQKKSLEDCLDDELPYGWEKIHDPQYGTYFIDHVNRRTQYENPVLEAKRRLERSRPSGSKDPIFTRNPLELRGERITTTLLKSSRGLGFTIVGGDDNVDEFLQIKSIVPNGPAWLDGKLQMGDVLVYVNDICVLGFTHHDMVNVFQSILPGETVPLEVCRGYPLPFDPNDPNTEVVTTIAVDGINSDPEKARILMDLNMDGNYNFLDMSDPVSPGAMGGSAKSPLARLQGEEFFPAGSFIVICIELIGGLLYRSAVGVLLLYNPPSFPYLNNPSGFFRRVFLSPKDANCLLTLGTILENLHNFPMRHLLDPNRIDGQQNVTFLEILATLPIQNLLHLLPIGTVSYCKPKSHGTLHNADTMHLWIHLSLQGVEKVTEKEGIPADSKSNTSFADHDSINNDIPYIDPFPKMVMALTDRLSEANINPNHDKYHQDRLHSASKTFASSQSDLNNYDHINTDFYVNAPVSNFGSVAPPPMPLMAAPIPTYHQDTCYCFECQDFNRQQMEYMQQQQRNMYNWQQVNGRASRKDEYALSEVTLERQTLGFGFRIVGGTEEGSQVTVGHIVPGGSADHDPRISTGDEILSIDGVNVVNASHHRVVQLMGEAALRGQVTMILRRKTPLKHKIYPYDVIVSRNENEGFGFVIISSTSQYYGSTIGKLIPGSPADRCAELKVGDRIVAVNRIDIAGMSHGDVVNLIKESGLHVRLTIGSPQVLPNQQMKAPVKNDGFFIDSRFTGVSNHPQL
uniref:Uncharacterized protein n=1 Tax=Phlebotomus papatasi TaxID=29031 RepID=A0A1B0DEK7_PHLPP